MISHSLDYMFGMGNLFLKLFWAQFDDTLYNNPKQFQVKVRNNLQSFSNITNIAKGTTDPRVEFCLPNLLILDISQGQTQSLIKFHLQNIDQAPTSKSRHQQTPVFRLNLKFKILTKHGFRISIKIQLHYLYKTSAAKY